MKQTAVEWLIDESMKSVVQYMQGKLNEDNLNDVIYEIGNKAKEMEKEQISKAYDCTNSMAMDGEEYYNETFKSE
jgi:hypothetical protein